jgi:organic hydroperoxide reductase OsmC/OhrA
MGSYAATVSWNRGEGEVFTDNRYSRAHLWAFDGGAEVKASASPHIVPLPFSDPAGVDPEEAFIASLSSCHMLFFLSFAARDGFAVSSYVDHAVGKLAKGADGRTWMTRVSLRPDARFDGDKQPTAQEIEGLHHEAHEACFIANSVKTEVSVTPVEAEDGVA